jgi:hypothetical protein
MLPPDDSIGRIHEYRLTNSSVVLSAIPNISLRPNVPLNLTHLAFFGYSLGGSASLSLILIEQCREKSKGKMFRRFNLDRSNFGEFRSCACKQFIGPIHTFLHYLFAAIYIRLITNTRGRLLISISRLVESGWDTGGVKSCSFFGLDDFETGERECGG